MIIDGELLDRVSNAAELSTRLRMNHNLHTSLDAKEQRLLNALEVVTNFSIHRHHHMVEAYILLRGKMDVRLYSGGTARDRLHTENGNYGAQFPTGQWHTLEVLKLSVIFEVKDAIHRCFLRT